MSKYMEKARAGDVEAMVQLGVSYYYGGGGVELDYGEALAWYGKAAAKGHGYALYALGVMNENGQGTPVNLLSALNYYKQSTDKGESSTADIARVERAIAADPTLRAAAAAAAAAASTEAARLEQDKARVQQQDAANKQKEAELKRREAASEKKEAELKQLQQTLETQRARQQQKDAELQQREAVVRQEEQALDAIKLEQDAQQRAKDQAAAAFIKGQKDAAAAKQAAILEERHTEGSPYVATRETVVAAWTPTKVKLADCPVHAQPITAGQSVLLEKCLHTICRDCAPHMIQADATVSCPICKVDSNVKRDALAPHPFIEAELAAGETHDCVICQTVPEDDRMPATVKCTSCAPEKLLCEGHAVNHRMNPKTAAHTVTPLPHGGAALRCPTHDKPIEAYCTGCRQLICLVCTLTTHPAATHTARMLTDATFVEVVRIRLVEAVAAARTVAEALVDHAADATLAVTEMDARDATIGSEIDRTINVLSGLLERRRKTMHGQRLARSRDERAALQTTRELSEYHWRIITSAANLAEQLAMGTHLGVNATAVMVQLEAAATARLQAVLELAPERGVPPPPILRFHFDEEVSKQLETLGQIVQDAP